MRNAPLYLTIGEKLRYNEERQWQKDIKNSNLCYVCRSQDHPSKLFPHWFSKVEAQRAASADGYTHQYSCKLINYC